MRRSEQVAVGVQQHVEDLLDVHEAVVGLEEEQAHGLVGSKRRCRRCLRRCVHRSARVALHEASAEATIVVETAQNVRLGVLDVGHVRVSVELLNVSGGRGEPGDCSGGNTVATAAAAHAQAHTATCCCCS